MNVMNGLSDERDSEDSCEQLLSKSPGATFDTIVKVVRSATSARLSADRAALPGASPTGSIV
jgi:hypothetical protein